MKTVLVDIETDGLNYSKIHCLAVKIYGEVGAPVLFTDMHKFAQWAEKNGVLHGARWVAHNGCGFDFHVLSELTAVDVSPSTCIDTQVLSKLHDYNKFNGHGLKEWGLYLGIHKGDYDGGWEKYSVEMGEYCVQDVIVLEAIYKALEHMVDNPAWEMAVHVEHDMAFICRDLETNGFTFNSRKALSMLSEIEEKLDKLKHLFEEKFPKKRVKVKTCKFRKKVDGSLYSNVVQDYADYEIELHDDGEHYDCFEYRAFNPGSPKDRIDILWDAGWKPYEKTKGHLKAIREARSK